MAAQPMASAEPARLPVIPVNIVGKRDNRCRISKAAKPLRLSEGEVRAIRQTSGRVLCPASGKFEGATGSGILVSEDVVCTAAHVFHAVQEKRKPLSGCWFETQEPRPKRFALDFSKEGRTYFLPPAIGEGMGQFVGDRSCVRLKKKAAGILPPVIDTNGEAVHRGSTLIPIAGVQLDMQKSDKGCRSSKEPIVQACALRLHIRVLVDNSFLLGDCDLSPGVSGGAVYMRVEGALVLVGMSVGVGPPSSDFKPYNNFPGEGEDFSGSIAIGFDVGFEEVMKKLGATGLRTWSQPATQ